MYKIGIVGYGNLGAALEKSVVNFPDLELSAVFSRRTFSGQKNDSSLFLPYRDILRFKGKIDVLVLAWGSSSDLTDSAEFLASHFNTVDSFDMHRDITKHRKNVGNVAKNSKKLSVVSSGWDPGLLSLARVYLSSFMPYAALSTFWGKGVSQGHSEAIRGIEGVRYAVQYTVPKDEARARAIRGEAQRAGGSHKRVCYVVAERGAEQRIEAQIRSMKGYFDGYETEVYFISESEFFARHTSFCHRGEVIASGDCCSQSQTASVTLDLSSNPLFTANILLATARAVCRLSSEGNVGALTLFDIPPKYFYYGDEAELL